MASEHRHFRPQQSGVPESTNYCSWIPAFAGMTKKVATHHFPALDVCFRNSQLRLKLARQL
jgi:hypothetical protein